MATKPRAGVLTPEPVESVEPPVFPVLAVPAVPLDDGVVRLRAWVETDIDQITVACQDERIQRFIPIPKPYVRDDARQYVARTRQEWASGEKAAFAIVDATDPAVVLGAINIALGGFTGTSAYWVAPAARGYGMARRALLLLTDWAFATVGLGIILLEIDPANEASLAVARSAGYHQCGTVALGTGTRPDAVTHLLFDRLAADPHV